MPVSLFFASAAQFGFCFVPLETDSIFAPKTSYGENEMNAQYCSKCGKSVSPQAKFCSDCGQPVRGGKSAGRAAEVSRRSSSKDWAVVGAVLILAAAVYLIFLMPKSGPAQPPQPATDIPGHEDLGESGMMGQMPDFPTDYVSLVSMGNGLMDQANFPLAAEAYKRALAIDSSSSDVAVDFGACLHGMGLDHRALEEFRKVLARDPDHAICNFNMGIVFSGLNQKDSARVYWERMLTIAPDGPSAEAARRYLKEMDG